MIYLLDADCCVYTLGGSHPALADRLRSQQPGSVAISTITLSEILMGSVNGKPPSLSQLDGFLRVIKLLSYDEPAAWAYARLPFRRARLDRLFAAHALSLGATIVTNNEADFAHIPGLLIENWTVAR